MSGRATPSGKHTTLMPRSLQCSSSATASSGVCIGMSAAIVICARVRPVDVGEERVEARAQALAKLGILLRAREQGVRRVQHEVVDPDLLAALGEQRRQRGRRAIAHVDGLRPPPRALRGARAQTVFGRAWSLREPRDRAAAAPLLEARRAERLAQMRVRRLEHFEDVTVGVDDRVADLAVDLLAGAHCSPIVEVGNGCHCSSGRTPTVFATIDSIV